ncbi:class I adenylate-forming enzyme family protein [Streptomyces sp. NPDC018964]|uniref:class I adenylate-forming enzyme family protein n=1 Tax=Streptomyces sp. NPDC018964 TaxID=3365058 RepID=UPI0037BB41EC
MIKLDDIRRYAAGRPEATAIADGEERLTWEQFAQAVDQVAAGLTDRLPQEGTARSVFLADNRWQLAVVMAACATLGVSCTGLDPAAGPEELTHTLTRLEPSLVFVTGEYREVLDRCVWPAGPQALHVLLDASDTQAAPGRSEDRRTLGFGELLETEPLARLPEPLSYESFTVVPGEDRPRIAVRRTPTEARRLIDLVDEFGFDAADVHLLAAPLWQQTAQDLTRTMLGLGATVVLGRYTDPAALAETIPQMRVTTAVIDPTALNELLAHPASASIASSSHLRCVMALGRHLGRWTVNTAWERLGPALHLAHATAQTGLNTIMTPEESLVVPMRSGRVTLGNTVAVLGEDGTPLSAGRAGRVAVAGHQVMDEYLDDEAPFVTLDLGQGEQRFFVTGDLGLMDEQGRLRLTGRTESVEIDARDGAVDEALFRLESDLLNLPCLRDTAVMRVDHPKLGDALVVPFIAVAVDREQTGYQALTASCARRVPSLPAHVIAVDEIPYSPTGRIRAGELLESVVPIITLNLQLEQSMHQEMSA